MNSTHWTAFKEDGSHDHNSATSTPFTPIFSISSVNTPGSDSTAWSLHITRVQIKNFFNKRSEDMVHSIRHRLCLWRKRVPPELDLFQRISNVSQQQLRLITTLKLRTDDTLQCKNIHLDEHSNPWNLKGYDPGTIKGLCRPCPMTDAHEPLYTYSLSKNLSYPWRCIPFIDIFWFFTTNKGS